MNVLRHIFSMIALVSLTALSAASSSYYAVYAVLASQLLVNGDFEQDSIEPWRSYGDQVSLRRDASQKRNGNLSAALTSNSLSDKWLYQTVVITGGSSYSLAGYVLMNKDSQASMVFLKIAWYSSSDAMGPEISGPSLSESVTSDSSQFRLLAVTATAPLAARSARIMGVLSPLSTASATVYFDDLSLDGASAPSATDTATPVPSATPSFTPTPTPSTEPTPTSTSTLVPTPTRTFTPTPTALPRPTVSPSPTPAPSPTPTPTPAPTAGPSVTPTSSPAPDAGSFPTPTPTFASQTDTLPGPTATSTPSPLPTATSSPYPTSTPTTQAGVQGPEPRVLITEVMVNPASGSETASDAEAASEWVEVRNAGAQAVELVGWTLTDNFSVTQLPGVSIGPGAYAVIAGDSQKFAQSYPGFSGHIVSSPTGRIGNGLSNVSDMLVLTDSSGRMKDRLNWGVPQTSWPNYSPLLWNPGARPPASGLSLARIIDQESGPSVSNWASSMIPSPGQPNPTPDVAPTPSPTSIAQATASATATAAPSRTATPLATRAGTATPLATPARTATPSVNINPSNTVTPTPMDLAATPSIGPSQAGTPAPAAEVPVGASVSAPVLIASPNSPLLPSQGGAAVAETPAPGAKSEVSPAAATPAALLTQGQHREQDLLQPPRAGPGFFESGEVGPTGSPDVLSLLFAAIPGLGLLLWLKDRFSP
ncbi:MAG: lamin tail domain-containing protein [Dehalococcoidia bacterium]|nr:lamin tail domain-containing protein [Dehalococcoidia bacterium]